MMCLFSKTAPWHSMWAAKRSQWIGTHTLAVGCLRLNFVFNCEQDETSPSVRLPPANFNYLVDHKSHDCWDKLEPTSAPNRIDREDVNRYGSLNIVAFTKICPDSTYNSQRRHSIRKKTNTYNFTLYYFIEICRNCAGTPGKDLP